MYKIIPAPGGNLFGLLFKLCRRSNITPDFHFPHHRHATYGAAYIRTPVAGGAWNPFAVNLSPSAAYPCCPAAIPYYVILYGHLQSVCRGAIGHLWFKVMTGIKCTWVLCLEVQLVRLLIP